MPRRSANPQACSGPPPPKAMSGIPRGSTPRSTLTRRRARAIVASAVAMMASAARSIDTPRGVATRAKAATAFSRLMRTPPLHSPAAMVPSTTCASVTVGCSPPRSYAAGPGIAPALCGPARRAPPSSSQAMLPPPAATASTNTRGNAMGMPATPPPRSTSGSPSSMSPTSALVPPMSIVSARDTPRVRAMAAAPVTPPAGPLSANAAACRAASCADSVPPADVITRGAGYPRCARRSLSPAR